MALVRGGTSAILNRGRVPLGSLVRNFSGPEQPFSKIFGLLQVNLPNTIISSVKSPFSNTTRFLFRPIFGPLCSYDPIDSIQNLYWSSPTSAIEASKFLLPSPHIFSPFVTICLENRHVCVESEKLGLVLKSQRSSSLEHFCHVPLKRDQSDWDGRMSLNDTPFFLFGVANTQLTLTQIQQAVFDGGLGNVPFLSKNKKSFCNGSRPRASWPIRLVLSRATPRAEVDIIGAHLCASARAIFPSAALSWSDCSLSQIIVDTSPSGLVSWLSMFLSSISNWYVRFGWYHGGNIM